MVTTVGAYLLIAIFLIIEGRLRKGRQAKSLRPGQYDRGSTRRIGLAFFVTFLILLITPILNYFQIGTLSPSGVIGGIGLALMLGGMALRVWASKTLGAFYTRTLLIQTEQTVVDGGPYQLIRHPGYLGDFTMFVGGGLAMANWIAFIAIFTAMFSAYAFRIKVEEQMLETTLGDPYRAYMKRTHRLIPWIY